MNRTPPSRIRSALRQLWMKSRERSEALKIAGYCCEKCGVKQSKAKDKEQKIVVHHKEGIHNWDRIIKEIQDYILCSYEDLEVLCPDCHDKITYS